jgi:hypothetical protein
VLNSRKSQVTQRASNPSFHADRYAACELGDLSALRKRGEIAALSGSAFSA